MTALKLLIRIGVESCKVLTFTLRDVSVSVGDLNPYAFAWLLSLAALTVNQRQLKIQSTCHVHVR